MARHTAPQLTDRLDAPAAPARPLAVSLLLSLRPSQWTKNLIIFAALMFGQRLLDPTSVLQATAGFVIFCALSGVVYLVNDIADRDADRGHPVKKDRPIASGALPVRIAAPAAVVIAAAGIASAYWLRPLFGVLATAYLLL
ncbi:MAG TPA: UbiA family prenyltransferase, partial [Vicinamibacterales bacterium]|nr:UbiA family prenyltransferase [Vicinamibacterales bacterium]